MMDENDFTELTTHIKKNNFTWSQQFEIMTILFDKVENKQDMINAMMVLMQRDVGERDRQSKKYVVAVEQGHPNTSPYSFIQYVKQHTVNGTILKSCPAFNTYFDKQWLPFMKKEVFDCVDWQESQGHKKFFDNLKKTLKAEDL